MNPLEAIQNEIEMSSSQTRIDALLSILAYSNNYHWKDGELETEYRFKLGVLSDSAFVKIRQAEWYANQTVKTISGQATKIQEPSQEIILGWQKQNKAKRMGFEQLRAKAQQLALDKNHAQQELPRSVETENSPWLMIPSDATPEWLDVCEEAALFVKAVDGRMRPIPLPLQESVDDYWLAKDKFERDNRRIARQVLALVQKRRTDVHQTKANESQADNKA